MSAVSGNYRRPLLSAIAWQALLGVLFAVGLDELLEIYVFSLLGFWTGAAIVILRRPTSPTRADRSFIRYGFPLVLVVGGLLVDCIWRLRGFTMMPY
jgi:hypothetical protein